MDVVGTTLALGLVWLVPVQQAPAPRPIVGSIPAEPEPATAATVPPAEGATTTNEAPANPAAAPATPPPASRPAAAVKPAAGETPEAGATPDVGEILGRSFVGTSTTDAMESEVQKLRRTLDALVGEGDSSADILSHLEEDVADLEGLGISPERAEAIRGLANDVNSLRAQLQLLHIQGRTVTSPEEELRDVKELLGELAREARAVAAEPAAEASTASTSAPAPDVEPVAMVRRSRFPEKEAQLAFLAGDDAAVVALLTPLDRAQLAPESLYAYGCALVNRRELDEARIVLSLIEEHEDRDSLRFAAARQLRRIEHLKNGIVSLDPLLKEGRDQ